MAALTAAWRPITHLPSHPRSSHTLSILQSSLHLFSGSLPSAAAYSAELYILPLSPAIPIAITVLASPLSPPPRISAASTVLDGTLYVFGGHGGSDTNPLVEGGRVWSFAAGGHEWTPLDPSDENAPFPEARSGHAMAAAGGKIYVHSGSLQDLWCFDVRDRRWERLADAPGDPKSGMGIAITGGRELWRFGGWERAVDVFDISNGTWRSIPYTHGPPARSGSGLFPIRFAQTGTEYLVTLFGERDPSAGGPGVLFDDVWAYNIANAEWSEVTISSTIKPNPRGQFAAVAVGSPDGGSDGRGVVVQGGLDEDNWTLEDWWLLEFN